MKNYFFICLFLGLITSTLFSQTDAMQPLKGICIYIDYPDEPAKVDHAQLDSLLNGINYQEAGVRRSFRKYWQQETRRNYDVTHDIFFFTADKPASHYASVTWQEGIDLWRIALESITIDYPNYDWSQLSTHPNGALREVMVISSTNTPAGVGGAHWPQYVLPNGVFISSIHGSFIQYPGQTSNNLFVICHEAGHSAFGFPDTYDTGAISSGTGAYSLMSGQGPDVPPVGAPFLVIQKWANQIEIEDPGEHTVTLTADGDDVFVYHNPHKDSEFFTIEARKNTTSGNSIFPAPLGLMVWHTDDDVRTSNTLNNMTENKHYRHSIEQADGLFELEMAPGLAPDEGDLYLPGRTFTDATVPDSKWWSGESSDFEIKDITFIGDDVVEFKVIIPVLHDEHYDEIPKDAWQLVSAPTEAFVGFGPEKAFDDDVNTYYHVIEGDDTPRPHEITIDLGEDYLVSELYYQASDNFSFPFEGRVEFAYVSISSDGVDFEEIGGDDFERSMYIQFMELEPTIGRYVRFSAVNSFDDDSRTSIAELGLRGIRADMVGNSKVSFEEFLQIYPNPASDFLNIKSSTNEKTELHMYDVNGETILLEIMRNSYSRVDISKLPSGVYTISAKSGSKINRQKFIKI